MLACARAALNGTYKGASKAVYKPKMPRGVFLGGAGGLGWEAGPKSFSPQ